MASKANKTGHKKIRERETEGVGSKMRSLGRSGTGISGGSFMVSTEIENEIKMAAVVGAGLHLGNTESHEILRIRSVDGHNAMYIVKYSRGKTKE